MLDHAFFRSDPVTCARKLIGCRLQWGRRAGMVVETEAYDAEGDESCHTWSRPSVRGFVANREPGSAYVYFSYGMHWMLNVLVKGRRQGFVLLRALEPTEGLAAMRRARGVALESQLCSGPGKLTQALGVTGTHDGMDLCADAAFAFYRGRTVVDVGVSPRIGISRAVDRPWRFFLRGSPHISAHPRGWRDEEGARKRGTGRTAGIRPAVKG